MDSEKITINLGGVDLGKIDLLVEDGFYGNRADFIRTAIRNQLDKHGANTAESAARRMAVLGAMMLEKADLEKARDEGRKLTISAIGVLTFAGDITPELASEVIESLYVRGIFRASPVVKAALADRTR